MPPTATTPRLRALIDSWRRDGNRDLANAADDLAVNLVAHPDDVARVAEALLTARGNVTDAAVAALRAMGFDLYDAAEH